MKKLKDKSVVNKGRFVFTVMDEHGTKPIVYAETVDRNLCYARENNHEISVELVSRWFRQNTDLGYNMPDDEEIVDIAYSMRKEGRSWYAERFCFELTELMEDK